jgi:hypothetical protein
MRWRRLDVPGSDECALAQLQAGWSVGGVAQFMHAGRPARLAYRVDCDSAWHTTNGEVSGHLGADAFSLVVHRDDAGDWHVDGRAAPALTGLVDLDLGFTPATNLFPLRRLALAPGAGAMAEAAWLDDADWRLKRLPQRYERRDRTSYWYESPATGYAALLRVTSDGFVRDYPGLWTAID